MNIAVNKQNRGERRAAAVTVALLAAALALLVALGCSNTHEPESQGTISLKFFLDEPPGEEISPSPGQVTPDSVVVRVFRGGNGVVEETARGLAINGAGSVDVTVNCVAEANKKVSVELYTTQHMRYFGVDERVDVTENENTDVMIDAYDIFVDWIAVSDTLIAPGDPPFDVYWTPVAAAASYLLLESSSPSFEQHLTQSFLTTDNIMTRNRPAGPWYYVVAPLNPYTVGTLSNIAYAYVQSVGEQPPQIDAMDPPEGPPGELITLSGSNLDVPGRVRLGASICPIVSATETELVFVVPASAQTGVVSLENVLNVAHAPGFFVVDRIAYVTATNQDESDATWYVDLVAKESNITSGMTVVPLREVADRDMDVFDVIVVAHDVTGPSTAEIQAIVESGANVLAVGRGGRTFFANAFPSLSGLPVTVQSRRDLYIPEGSFTLFQLPYRIAPPGPSVQEVCQSNQAFTGIDIDGVAVPASLMTFAALSIVDPTSYVLLSVESTTVDQQVVYNFYWGFEGDPNQLNSLGSEFVTNIMTFLANTASAVALTPAQVSF